MVEIATTTRNPRRRAAHALVFAALCAVLVAVFGISSAGATRAKVIGKTKHTPNPSCPAKKTGGCSVIGSVTGFMTKADGEKGPFHVFKDGTIVAWAIDLSKPSKNERKDFVTLFKNKTFGGHPSARISVLKSQGHHKFKLIRESEAIDLNNSMGRKQLFTLNKPLNVRKGQVIALTAPTWASAFAFGNNVSAKGDQWRASRSKKRCNVSHSRPNIEASKPQQKVGGTRRYACKYTGARLLYWAYFVPKQK